MKIVQFVHGLNMGGAETLVKEYSLRLKKLDNVEVTVLCIERLESPYEDMLEQAGISVIYVCDMVNWKYERSILQKVKRKLLLYKAVRQSLHQLQPDVVHVHLTLNEYIRYAKLPSNTRIVYTQHFQVDRWKEIYPRDIAYLRWIIKHYHTQIIAINESMKEEINTLFGISETIVLKNGVDVEKFQNAKEVTAMRDELEISDNTFVVGHVGRFNDIKNQLFLLDVFAEIQKRIGNTKLILIGAGKAEEKIKEKAKQLGVIDDLVILHDRTDVCDLLQAMDIFIFPSKSEGLGIAVIEAQVAGIKCLASSVLPVDTKISNYIEYLSLHEPANRWAEKAIEMKMLNIPIEYSGIEQWNMNCIIKKLFDVYKQL